MPRALQHDFAVKTDRIQYPLGFLGVIALLPGSADAPAQCVVAVANSGVAALNFGEPVVGAPAVVGGLLEIILLDELILSSKKQITMNSQPDILT